MKKFFHLTNIIFFLMSLSLLLSACNKPPKDPLQGSTYYPTVPEWNRSDYDPKSSKDLEVDVEYDYSNITARTEYNEYVYSDDLVIQYNVKNNNPNAGFWVYYYPQLEFYNGSEWVLLPFYNRVIVMGYMYCYGNKGTTGCVDIPFNLALSDVAYTFKEGEYRIVAFTPERPVYANFRLVME